MVYVAEIAETLTKPFVLVDTNNRYKGPYMEKQIQDMEEYWFEVFSIDYDTEEDYFVLSI